MFFSIITQRKKTPGILGCVEPGSLAVIDAALRDRMRKTVTSVIRN